MALENKYRILVGLASENATKDVLLSLLLSQAEKKVLKARHPFGYTDDEKAITLERYSDNVEEIYTYLYNKRGAEGETSHSESGISRGYESAGIPDSYINDIVPLVKAF